MKTKIYNYLDCHVIAFDFIDTVCKFNFKQLDGPFCF